MSKKFQLGFMSCVNKPVIGYEIPHTSGENHLGRRFISLQTGTEKIVCRVEDIPECDKFKPHEEEMAQALCSARERIAEAEQQLMYARSMLAYLGTALVESRTEAKYQ